MLSYLDRVLADSADRASWMEARGPRIGASDAAKFAKPESVPLYIDGKVNPPRFAGNATTENGNRWEPMLLAWAGIPQNTLFIHHPEEEGFAATPDGLEVSGSRMRLAEIKTKHNKIISEPTPAELRQVAWQIHVLQEAECVVWVWGEVVQVNGDWELREDSPKSIVYERTDPLIIGIQNKLIPIATEVLAGMRHQRQLKESAGF